MTKEEQIKIIDKLIDSQKKLQEEYNKAIKDLGDAVCPRILRDLGFQLAECVSHISSLEEMKDIILHQGLGNEYADRAFAIGY